MKMYVLVRKDLSRIQQAVQSAHALGEYLKRYPETPWANGTLVLMGVPDLETLLTGASSLEDASLEHALFYEPDIEEHTAVSFVLDKDVQSHARFKRKVLDRHARLLQFTS